MEEKEQYGTVNAGKLFTTFECSESMNLPRIKHKRQWCV